MQIDLANTLVHKAYFVYYALFIITRKLGLPSLGRGWGWAFSLPLRGEAFEKGLECVCVRRADRASVKQVSEP